MLRRRRALGLALLALAAPLPAFAISELAPSTESQVAELSVSASLGSCGVLEVQLVCSLNVSFEAIEGATSYSASVTRADGSVMEAGSVSPAGSSIYVPYVGSGTYSVRVTAYGDPPPVEETGEEVKPEVIASDAAEATAERENDEDRELSTGAAATVESETGPREDLPGGAPADAGELEPAPECSDAAAAAPAELPPLPEPPPEDLDPANPDEDADLIRDEQERLDYEAAVAARAEAEAQAPPPAPAGC